MRLPITAFLLNVEATPWNSLTPTASAQATVYKWENGALVVVDRLLADAGVILVLLRSPMGPARWQSFIENAFGATGFRASVTQSLGAIVFCAVRDPVEADVDRRWIAWTFGSGSRALRQRSVDPRFGLLTALNRISAAQPEGDDPRGRLNQFQYRQFGVYRQRTTHQAARDIPVEGFRFQRHMDLLSGAGGPRADTGGHIFGGRPLRVREDLDRPEDLTALAQAAIEDFREETYERTFPFLNDYVYVDAPVTVATLRNELMADLMSGSDSVDVFLPDDLTGADDQRAIHYILFPGEQARGASRTTLTLDGIRAKIDRGDESVLDWTLRFCSTDKDVVGEATLFDCLSADLRVGDQRYLASDGSFFLVKQEFIEAVDEGIAALTETELHLPCYRGGREGNWNLAVAAGLPDDFVCLDGDLVRLPGETPFEAADLVHVSGRLIHAKKKGRSSALSYLFVQTRRSCQLLSEMSEARRQLRDKVAAAAPPGSHERYTSALEALDERPSNLEVVIAILGDWKGRDLGNLPLLAKLEFLETTRAVGLYGFSPSVALVDICR